MLRPTLPFVIAVAVSLAAVRPASGASPTDAGAPATVRYQLGLLARGPTWTPERNARTDSIQAGHMANIGRMAERGALVAAGPFQGGGDMRGIFVFAPDADSLEGMLAGDPAIASGRLECRLATWLAPPGLGQEYRERAAANGRAGQGMPDSMVSFGWVMLHRGPKYDSRPSSSVEKLIKQHFEYTEKLRASGQLVYAGAIEGTGDLRGVLVLKGDSTAVANAIRSDPAVKAGRFAPRTLRWWTAWGTIPGH
jgi:uncharacterized protein YciI